MKQKLQALLLTIMMLLAVPSISFADAVEGDTIVSLGENLTEQQKNDMLAALEVPENAQTITVSNQEEHDYLGEFIPKAQIGSRAISSASITMGAKDSGLDVQTNNITWVTDEMYINALTTAGVKDAAIRITAPFDVSGTAALTGIMKAYEATTNKEIPEEIKKAANEEMVKTAQLGDSVGADNAAALMGKVKEEIAKNEPKTEADLRALIEQVAVELGITLTDAEVDRLVEFFNGLKAMDIDWNQVKEQLSEISTFLQSEEGQSFLQKLQDFINSSLDEVRALFA
ncbi:DUF1002 domain-containing protein [Bacillus sp. EB106-08-02-XG196]|uniref:DUF1002 domain-containing protein n=1 Tax=Bacillus sp. EB106-08-02-XG196 TaxID=2737049 RepID=UPI0015C4B66A|nr:DUF1002 domain-containing protein [Bacillus sp. EB106-08-02-XG196]NWQ39737.1 DUF1002 domain-containing protein [Bacillus sp. EB106-08-02-XG196]